MKVLRRLLWIAGVPACLGIALILSGCGSSSKNSSSSAASASTSSSSSTSAASGSGGSSGGGINIGSGTIHPDSSKKSIAVFVQASPSYSYSLALAKGAQAEAKKLGYSATIIYDNLSPQTELSGFQQAIASGKYGGIVLEPVDQQLCIPIRAEAVKYNMPVAIVGTALCDKGNGSGVGLWAPGTITFVGGQNNLPGAEQVLATAGKLSPGPQKVIMVMGPNGYPSVVAWQTAFKKFQATHSNWSLLDTVYGDFSTPTAYTDASNALTGHRDATVIISPYVDVTAGVVKAISNQGLTGKIAVYDNGGGSTTAANFVKTGVVKGDLPTYPESEGTTGVQQVVNALQGKTPPRFVGGDGNPLGDSVGVLTKANIASYKPQW